MFINEASAVRIPVKAKTPCKIDCINVLPDTLRVIEIFGEHCVVRLCPKPTDKVVPALSLANESPILLSITVLTVFPFWANFGVDDSLVREMCPTFVGASLAHDARSTGLWRHGCLLLVVGSG